MSVSVVIPARNAEATIGSVVEALATEPGVAEVIVVDDGSTDGTSERASAAGARVLRLEVGRGPAGARNLGARESRSPVILFVDSDTVAEPGIPMKVLAALEDPEIGGVQGIYLPSDSGEPWPTRFQNDYYHFVFTRGGRRRTAVAATFCFAIRWKLLLDLDGFDEAVRTPTVEDEAFGYRLYRAGHPILLDPGLRVRHLARYGLRSLLERKLRMARGQGKLLLRNRKEQFTGLPTHHPGFMKVGVPATAGALIAVLAHPLGPARWLLVLALSAAVSAGAWPFWRFLIRGRWRMLPVAVGLTLLDNLTIALGLALGLGAGLLGRRY